MDATSSAPVFLSDLKSGDLMLSREPICSNPFACFMRSLMCVKVHHVGLLVKPEDFDETSYVRQAYPEMDATKMYVLHFLNSGLKLWDLERYIRRIREGCVPGMAYVRQLQWEQAEQRRAFQLQLDLAFEEFKNRGYEKSFLTSGGIAFCDAVEACGMCKGQQDTSSIFCSEFVAEVLQRGALLDKSRASSEFTPMDFWSSDGQHLEETQFLKSGLASARPIQV